MALKRLGQILVDLGLIDEQQLETMLEEQSNRGGEPLGKVGVSLGFFTEEQLGEALAEQWGTTFVTLYDRTIPPDVLALVSEPMAQLYRVVPLKLERDRLTIATADPQKMQIADELRTLLGYDIQTCVATEAEITKAIEKHYSESSESVESLVEDLEADLDLAAQAAAFAGTGPIDLTSAEALAESAPVRKLLNMVLLLAIRDSASDIHFEPFETEFRIRLKSDGVLQEMVPPPKHLAFAITTRIKVMANLDIAERRLPQDGRIELTVGGHPVDLRVSVLPTLFGESVVMRVLDRGVVSLDLTKVGMNEETLRRFREVIERPNGIVLVTGPTGSGKTTTLYAALNELNRPDTKIITAEDPVEYYLAGINQVEVRHQIGLDFARIIRSMLRQAPNVILVGEMRDTETAQMGIQASLTGHLVFSTLHTNDAPGAVTRMIDMGVPAYLVASSVIAVLAQRLVRINCPKCKQPFQPLDTQLEAAGVTPEMLQGATLMKGRGCAHCQKSGYKGRLGIFELMVMTSRIRELAFQGAPTQDIRRAAVAQGMRVMFDDGVQKALKGLTTLDEVFRVSKRAEE